MILSWETLLTRMHWCYLTNRLQVVQANGKTSRERGLVCSVPQGSNLRPLLFILYITDLPNYLRDAKCLLFADDTSIFN